MTCTCTDCLGCNPLADCPDCWGVGTRIRDAFPEVCERCQGSGQR